jgi:hypothetical protein
VQRRFTRDRLRTVLPRLQARWQELAPAEALAAWQKDFDAVEIECDQMVAELREVYPAAVATLVDLMARIADVDRKGDCNAPPGAKESLHRVEREARCQLLQPDSLLTGDDGLRLPLLDRNGGPLYAWPPPQPSLAAQMASMPVPSGPGPDWHAVTEERDRRRREESQRLSAYYEERERELAKRREVDLREAREAHRRRQHG